MNLRVFDKILRNLQYFWRFIFQFIRWNKLRIFYQKISNSRRINRLLKSFELIFNLFKLSKDKTMHNSHKLLKILLSIHVNIFFIFDFLIFLINNKIINDSRIIKAIFKFSSGNWIISAIFGILLNLFEMILIKKKIYKNKKKLRYLKIEIIKNIFDMLLAYRFYKYRKNKELYLSIFGLSGSILGLINIIK